MAKIATVNNLNTLINYLGTSLDWPVDNDSLDELVFEYEAFEVGIHDENTVKIKNVFILSGLHIYYIYYLKDIKY
jgi:hypothetical protein